jgi:hypothetical protein
MPSGKFKSEIKWGGKTRTILPSKPLPLMYVSVRKDLDDAKRSAFGTDAVDTIFDSAKKKALETVKAA